MSPVFRSPCSTHATPLLPSPSIAKLLSAVALGALMGFNISAAKADDTREEIRQLKAEIKRLEAKAARQKQQIRGVAKFPKMPPLANVPVVCKDAPCPPPLPPVFVSFANGLQVDSWDDAFSFRIGGRVLVDGGVNSQPVEAFPPPGITLPAGVRPIYRLIQAPDFPITSASAKCASKSSAKPSIIGNISFNMTSWSVD
jgi:hypothetical protein